MKLYSTISSERATKSQGGNRNISFKLCVGDQNNSMQVFECVATYKDGVYRIYASTTTGVDDQSIDYIVTNDELKGKRQKGEHDCIGCGATGRRHAGFCDSCKGIPEHSR